MPSRTMPTCFLKPHAEVDEGADEDGQQPRISRHTQSQLILSCDPRFPTKKASVISSSLEKTLAVLAGDGTTPTWGRVRTPGPATWQEQNRGDDPAGQNARAKRPEPAVMTTG